MANSIIDPADPYYCATCGGECTADCRISMATFLARYPVTMRVTRTDRNPSMPDSREMDHWRCTIRHGRARMTIVFSMGYGHKGAEPTIAAVLDCLASDASSVAHDSFEDWCNSLGYDSDSRTAARTYNACRRQATALQRVLGADAFETLLYHTERE